MRRVMKRYWKERRLAGKSCLPFALAALVLVFGESQTRGSEVTLRGSVVCNGACIPNPKKADHVLVVFARNGNAEIRAAVDRIDMSDEGLMAQDIEDCLGVVLKALAKCDMPAAEVIAWCTAMLDTDRVGFIARESLQSLRKRVQATAGR